MPTVIDGSFSIRDALQITRQYAKSRFAYKNRDVVKRITIKRIQQYSPDRKGAPKVLFQIESKSYPQYKPYTNHLRPGRRYQRRTSHEYDLILQMDRLSIDTKNWRTRLGSQGNWVSNPPQNSIKSIYRRTRETWKKRYTPKQLKEKIAQHKKRARYLDVGDWNAQVKGKNGDWHFRLSFAYNFHGHLYGRDTGAYSTPAAKTNPGNVLFLTKHHISVIEALLNRGILKAG